MNPTPTLNAPRVELVKDGGLGHENCQGTTGVSKDVPLRLLGTRFINAVSSIIKRLFTSELKN
jgi:hypothetical protein